MPALFRKDRPQRMGKGVLPAFGAVNDANAELFKEHTGYHRPLFTFDVIADHLYQNQHEPCPLAERLQEFSDFISG